MPILEKYLKKWSPELSIVLNLRLSIERYQKLERERSELEIKLKNNQHNYSPTSTENICSRLKEINEQILKENRYTNYLFGKLRNSSIFKYFEQSEGRFEFFSLIKEDQSHKEQWFHNRYQIVNKSQMPDPGLKEVDTLPNEKRVFGSVKKVPPIMLKGKRGPKYEGYSVIGPFIQKKCRVCQREFITTKKNQIYCWQECYYKAYNEKRRKQRIKKICPHCGEEYSAVWAATCSKSRCRKREYRLKKK